MIQTLQRKFVLISMLLAAAVLAAVTAFFITTTRDSLAQDSISVLYRVTAETDSGGWEEGKNVSLPYFVVVIRPDGGAEITDSQFYTMDDSEQLLAAVNAAMEQQSELGLLTDYNFRYLRTATENGWRLVFVDISYERSTLNRAVGNAALVGLGALAVFLLLSVLLSKWAVRPVEKAWQQQRQFVADASHELKTPLTVILSNADLMEQSGDALTPPQQRRLGNIRSGGEQMKTLVEQLLVLARSDNEKSPKVPFQQVDFSDLTRTAALMFEASAFEAGLTLESEEIEPELRLKGDSVRLKQLLDILLENAVKYSEPGGRICVSLTQTGKKLRLEVSNEGTPIPKEELERIFDRFYRGDSARTGQGFGLGLSIARAIAKDHRGKLWAESDPAGVNTFICTLPAERR